MLGEKKIQTAGFTELEVRTIITAARISFDKSLMMMRIFNV